MSCRTSYKSFVDVILFEISYFFQIKIANDGNNMHCMIACVNAILIPCCCTTLSKFQPSLQNWDSSKTFSLFLFWKIVWLNSPMDVSNKIKKQLIREQRHNQKHKGSWCFKLVQFIDAHFLALHRWHWDLPVFQAEWVGCKNTLAKKCLGWPKH